MVDEPAGRGPGYGQGFRDGVGMIVRGLLLVEADQVDLGALIGALSRYEQELETWRDAGEGDAGTPAPPWRPTARDIGADEEGT
ncbi:MAG: hypothetical protein M3Q65_17545 [Chloroflexota bacterium]|nr:hypothetical protein [Chloroflexota bacterium]